MHQAGPFNPDFGAESFGLKDLNSISYNLEAPRLVEDAIRRAEATMVKEVPLTPKRESIRAARPTTSSQCATRPRSRRYGGTTIKQ